MNSSSLTPNGVHIIADLYGCNLSEVTTVDALSAVMERLVSAAHLVWLGASFYQFPGQGITGIVLLSQSHISIHTWPEFGFITFDLFSCGGEEDAIRAFDVIREVFQPDQVVTVLLERGIQERPRAGIARLSLQDAAAGNPSPVTIDNWPGAE